MASTAKIFALYRGDEMIDSGTVWQLAKRRGVQIKTIQFYGSPTYQKRGRGNSRKRLSLVLIED